MASHSRIVELASAILSNTKAVDEYISINGLPTPSFAIEAPPILPLPEDISKSRDKILEASEELRALVAGPLPHLIHLTGPTVSRRLKK